MSERPPKPADDFFVELRHLLIDVFEGAAHGLRNRPSTAIAPERPPPVPTPQPTSQQDDDGVPPDAHPELGTKLMFTVTEVAQILGMHRTTAYDAVKSGSINSMRVGSGHL